MIESAQGGFATKPALALAMIRREGSGDVRSFDRGDAGVMGVIAA
jgi:hypothetical protein